MNKLNLLVEWLAAVLILAFALAGVGVILYWVAFAAGCAVAEVAS